MVAACDHRETYYDRTPQPSSITVSIIRMISPSEQKFTYDPEKTRKAH